MKLFLALAIAVAAGPLTSFASEEDFSKTFDCSQALNLDLSNEALLLAWLTGRMVTVDADLNGTAFRGEVQGARHLGGLKYELLVLETEGANGQTVTRPHPIDPSVEFRVE